MIAKFFLQSLIAILHDYTHLISNMTVKMHFYLLKLLRAFKLIFVIFVLVLVLLNAILLNIYNNVLVTSKNESNELIKVSSSRVRWPKMRNQRNLASNYSLNSDDYKTLLNVSDFQFLLNHPDTCEKIRNLFMIVFVHSAAGNFAKRDTIRKTWANKNNFKNDVNQIRVIFLVGQTNDSNITQRLQAEDGLFEDIVQGNFIDAYRNMTYKHVMGLKWVSYFCAKAQFIFKADDDIFVDLFQLTYYLKGTFGHSPRNLIACYLYKHSWANRSYRNKWRVSYKEYSGKYYPQYCAGWGIIMSPDVVRQLYRISRSRPFFWIDDVFVSGILAQDLNINHIDMGVRVSIDDGHIDSWLDSDQLTLPPMFGLPNSEASKIMLLWNKTVQYYQTKFNYSFS